MAKYWWESAVAVKEPELVEPTLPEPQEVIMPVFPEPITPVVKPMQPKTEVRTYSNKENAAWDKEYNDKLAAFVEGKLSRVEEARRPSYRPQTGPEQIRLALSIYPKDHWKYLRAKGLRAEKTAPPKKPEKVPETKLGVYNVETTRGMIQIISDSEIVVREKAIKEFRADFADVDKPVTKVGDITVMGDKSAGERIAQQRATEGEIKAGDVVFRTPEGWGTMPAEMFKEATTTTANVFTLLTDKGTKKFIAVNEEQAIREAESYGLKVTSVESQEEITLNQDKIQDILRTAQQKGSYQYLEALVKTDAISQNLSPYVVGEGQLDIVGALNDPNVSDEDILTAISEETLADVKAQIAAYERQIPQEEIAEIEEILEPSVTPPIREAVPLVATQATALDPFLPQVAPEVGEVEAERPWYLKPLDVIGSVFKAIDRPWSMIVNYTLLSPRKEKLTEEERQFAEAFEKEHPADVATLTTAPRLLLEEAEGEALFPYQVAEEPTLGERFVSQFKPSPELVEAYEALPEWKKIVGEISNPIFFIPISGGLAAIGGAGRLARVARALGRGLQVVEKGLAYPITKPLGLAGRGATRSAQAGLRRIQQIQMQHLAAQFKFTPMLKLEEELFRPTLMRRISEWIAKKLPGSDYLIKIANPTYGIPSDVHRAFTVRQVWQVQLNGMLEQELARFGQYNWVQMLGIKKGVTRWGMPAGDLIENIERYAVKYGVPDDVAGLCRGLRETVGKWADFYTACGGKINEKVIQGGGYFPRFAVRAGDIELSTRFGSLSFGKRPSSLRPRWYNEMATGVANNVEYLDDPFRCATIYCRSMGSAGLDKKIVQEMVATGIPGFPRKITDIIKPGLITERDATRRFRNAQDYMLKMTNRAARGEQLHASSWRALDKINLDIANQLRQARTVKEFKVIKDIIKEGLSDAQSRYINALRGYEQGINGVRASANNVNLTNWAFSGHLASPEVAQEISKYFSISGGYKYVKGFNDYFNRVIRFAQTGFDLGVGHIQLLPMAILRPDWWVKTQIRSLKFFLSERSMYEFWGRPTVNAIRLEMIEVARMELGRGAAELVETGILSKLDKTPFVGRLGKGFARQFSSAIDLGKFYTYRGLRGIAKGDPEKLRVVGDFIDKLYGTFSTAKIGMNPLHGELEAALLYAPRYLRAYLGLFTDMFQGGMKGHLARTAFGSVLAGMTAEYYALNKAFQAIGWTDYDPVLDPREGACFTVQFNENAPAGFRNRHVGLGSNWVSMFLRLPANIYEQASENPDKLISLNWNDNALLRALRGKSSIFMGSAIDVLTKRNYFGELLTIPENLTAEALETIFPFWLQVEAEDNSLMPHITFAPGEFLGMRSWTVHQYEIMSEKLDKAAAKWCKENDVPVMTWKELREQNKYAQMEILEANPDLVKMQEEQADHWAKNHPDDLSTRVNEAFEIAQRQYVSTLDHLCNLLLEGKLDIDDWGKKVREAGAAYGGAMNLIQEDYPEILKEWEENRDVPELSFNVAYYDYIDKIVAADFLDADGLFSWDIRDKAIRDFTDRWGEDIVQKIEAVFEFHRGVPELIKVRKALQEKLEPYWDIDPAALDASEQRETYLLENPFADAATVFLGYRSVTLTDDAEILLGNLVALTGVPKESVMMAAFGVRTKQFYLMLKDAGIPYDEADKIIRRYRLSYKDLVEKIDFTEEPKADAIICWMGYQGSNHGFPQTGEGWTELEGIMGKTGVVYASLYGGDAAGYIDKLKIYSTMERMLVQKYPDEDKPGESEKSVSRYREALRFAFPEFDAFVVREWGLQSIETRKNYERSITEWRRIIDEEDWLKGGQYWWQK